MDDRKYAIAEEFDSIQGEGYWTGTAMRFVRFAGCNVGKLQGGWIGTQSKEGENYEATCTLWDGRTFACDTNYQRHYSKTASELHEPVWQNHVCFTGGEPLTHDLFDLTVSFLQKGIEVHFETSGTRCPDWFDNISHNGLVWVSVSPKKDCLPQMIKLADEIKLLVDENFKPETLPWEVMNKLVYIQPVNNEMTVNRENLERCLELQKRFKDFRISSQLHKFMNVR